MSIYPDGIDNFTTKENNVDDVMAADINNLQSSIVAIETFVGSGSSNFLAPTGNVTMNSGTSFAPHSFYLQNPFMPSSDTLTITSIGTGIVWAPNQNLTEVTTMSVISGNLYVGGAFSEVNGVMRTGLAAFDIADNYSLTSWAPQLIPPQGTTLTVNMILSSPNGLILGGKFSGVNATIRVALAEIDLAGNLTSFYNSLLPSGGTTEVRAAHITGNYLYAGGFFASVSGNTTYNNFAAYDKHTGELNYQFTPGGFSAVNDIFPTASGMYVPANNVTSISGSSGPKTNPMIDYSGNCVSALSNLFSGTSFSTIAIREPENNELCVFHSPSSKLTYYPQMFSLASPVKYNYVTKEISPFSAYLNITVSKAIEYSGVIFYIGGNDTNYGSSTLGIAGMNVGAIDGTTGQAKNFNLDLDQRPTDMLIYDRKLYLCGSFRGFQHNKQSVSQIIAIDLPDSLFS